MLSGDGLLTTVRPFAGRLEHGQVLGLLDLAEAYAGGELTLTRRAGIQLRGISERDWPAVREGLHALRLDATDTMHAGPRLLVSPFALPTSLSWRLGERLRPHLRDHADLPPKFTVVCDAGATRDLASIPADVRIERDADDDRLLLRLGNEPTGLAVETEHLHRSIDEVLTWFVTQRRPEHRRIAALLAEGSAPAGLLGAVPPAASSPKPPLGRHAMGTLLGAPFGVLEAPVLRTLVHDLGVKALRITPWRSLLLEEAANVITEALLTHDADPLVDVDACPGAPRCVQATVPTRPLARQLARRLRPGGEGPSIHVTGCSKGCARSRPATLVCIGRSGHFDLVRDGRADDTPSLRGLSIEQLLQKT